MGARCRRNRSITEKKSSIAALYGVCSEQVVFQHPRGTEGCSLITGHNHDLLAPVELVAGVL